MKSKKCQSCGKSFKPCPQVPNQTFCSDAKCQRTRRRQWQQNKLKSDPDYRENQSRAQRAWLDQNPGYWRDYRRSRTQPVKQNQQGERPSRAKSLRSSAAKMDVSLGSSPPPAGLYVIKPIKAFTGEVGGTWLVEMTPVCSDSLCKKDECKERM
jgi:hypothetical protein